MLYHQMKVLRNLNTQYRQQPHAYMRENSLGCPCVFRKFLRFSFDKD